MVRRKECSLKLMNYLFWGFLFDMFRPKHGNSEIKTTNNSSSTYVKNVIKRIRMFEC